MRDAGRGRRDRGGQDQRRRRPAAGDRGRASRWGCAAPGSSTPWPSSSRSACSTAPAGCWSPTRPRASSCPAWRTGSSTVGGERVFVLHWKGAPRRRRPRRSTCRSATCASCSSPRPRSPPAGSCCVEELGVRRRRHPAGAARRVVRLVPVAGERRPDRPGAQGARAADRQRRQRRGRGREDDPAVGARARGRADAAGGGALRRALRPQRTSTTSSSSSSSFPGLNAARPGADRRPRPSASASSPAGRSPCRSAGSPPRRGLAGRRAPPAAAAAQPPRADRRRPSRTRRPRAARRATPGWRSRTPTAARTGRSTRSATGSGCPAARATHCYDVLRRRPSGSAELLRRRARDLPAHRLPGGVVPAQRRRRAGPGPVPASCATDYFRHYRRVVWLAQHPTPALRRPRRTLPRSSVCRWRGSTSATAAWRMHWNTSSPDCDPPQ